MPKSFQLEAGPTKVSRPILFAYNLAFSGLSPQVLSIPVEWIGPTLLTRLVGAAQDGPQEHPCWPGPR
ncbi:MAG TPA: hypothetical protein VMV05_09545 [bacterium]|nr:hypothetical protein [bacterium]